MEYKEAENENILKIVLKDSTCYYECWDWYISSKYQILSSLITNDQYPIGPEQTIYPYTWVWYILLCMYGIYAFQKEIFYILLKYMYFLTKRIIGASLLTFLIHVLGIVFCLFCIF